MMSTTEPKAVIEVRDLVKVYGGETRALDGITFEVAPGELFGFLGPNGAGKTTTIRILATLLRPTSGTARVAGFDVVSHGHEVRKRLGLAMQTPTLDAFSTGPRDAGAGRPPAPRAAGRAAPPHRRAARADGARRRWPRSSPAPTRAA